jgi:hypothetical protein
MKNKINELERSVDCAVTDEQAEKLRVIKAHYDAITFCKNDLDSLIQELGKEFQEQQAQKLLFSAV